MCACCVKQPSIHNRYSIVPVAADTATVERSWPVGPNMSYRAGWNPAVLFLDVGIPDFSPIQYLTTHNFILCTVFYFVEKDAIIIVVKKHIGPRAGRIKKERKRKKDIVQL